MTVVVLEHAHELHVLYLTSEGGEFYHLQFLTYKEDTGIVKRKRVVDYGTLEQKRKRITSINGWEYH